jgi:hypothetical protein
MAASIRERMYDSVVITDADGNIVLHAHGPGGSVPPEEDGGLNEDGVCKICASGLPFCTRIRRVVTDEKHVQLYADDVLFAEHDL